MKLSDIISESSAKYHTAGLQYEKLVGRTLKNAGLSTTRQTIGRNTFNAHTDGDLFFMINRKKYYLEVKGNWLAQMGSTSIGYYPKAHSLEQMFSIVDRNKFSDPDFVEMIYTALGSKIMQLNDLIMFIQKYPSNTGVNKKVNKFPMVCSRNGWKAAAKQGLLRAINSQIKYDATIIVDHYRNKHVNYMQINGLGAFYLASNPANLPIPQLQGEVSLEMRGVQGGSKFLSGSKEQISSCILRITPRLRFRQQSPYSFDNINSIDQMIGNIPSDKFVGVT